MSAVVARPVAPTRDRRAATGARLRASWRSSARPRSCTRSGSRPSRCRTWRTAATRRCGPGSSARSVTALALELRRGTMTGMTVAVLGVLAATGGLLRLVVAPARRQRHLLRRDPRGRRVRPPLRPAARHVRVAVSAVITGGIGPWLPFQMLGTGAMGATAGSLGGRRCTCARAPRWWWSRRSGGAGASSTARSSTSGSGRSRATAASSPGSRARASSRRCTTTGRSTSRRPPWDAASALANAVLILLTGGALLATLRRVAHRLDPAQAATSLWRTVLRMARIRSASSFSVGLVGLQQRSTSCR